VFIFAMACHGASAATPAAKVVEITIDKVTFSEVKVTLNVGDTIEWVNKDVVDHTATAKNKDWDVVIPAGKKARLVLKKAGTFDYFCRYHPNMVGKLVIAPAK